MEIEPIEPPREFGVGRHGGRISHCANIRLQSDEQITLLGPNGSENDVVRKSWGYYATASLNGRLPEHGLQAALCIGVPREGQSSRRMYLMLVEERGRKEFASYLELEEMEVLCWLDDDKGVARMIELLGDAGG